jgi:hypothetical protein
MPEKSATPIWRSRHGGLGDAGRARNFDALGLEK